MCRTQLNKRYLSCTDYGRMHNGGGPNGCQVERTLNYVSLMEQRCTDLELGISYITSTPPTVETKENTTPTIPTTTTTRSSIAILAESIEFRQDKREQRNVRKERKLRRLKNKRRRNRNNHSSKIVALSNILK